LKAIILAAGYATRLYPLTKDTPKTLLPVAGKPILEYIVEQIAACRDIDRVYLVTNSRFFPNFSEWLKAFRTTVPEITIVDDGTLHNSERLGTIGDLRLAIESQELEDDLLVICSDKIFEFKMSDFVKFFRSRREAVNACFETGDRERIRGKHGCVLLNEKGRILEFQEKPAEPKSSVQSIAFYIFPRDSLHLVGLYLEENGNKDAPGYLLQWLCRRIPVYAWMFTDPCYDVGTPESYRRVDELYRSRSSGRSQGSTNQQPSNL
jgi:glucose-1-phosphate thymidylyltransferase